MKYCVVPMVVEKWVRCVVAMQGLLLLGTMYLEIYWFPLTLNKKLSFRLSWWYSLNPSRRGFLVPAFEIDEVDWVWSKCETVWAYKNIHEIRLYTFCLWWMWILWLQIVLRHLSLVHMCRKTVPHRTFFLCDKWVHSSVLLQWCRHGCQVLFVRIIFLLSKIDLYVPMRSYSYPNGLGRWIGLLHWFARGHCSHISFFACWS